jgi:hypothetical protein
MMWPFFWLGEQKIGPLVGGAGLTGEVSFDVKFPWTSYRIVDRAASSITCSQSSVAATFII